MKLYTFFALIFKIKHKGLGRLGRLGLPQEHVLKKVIKEDFLEGIQDYCFISHRTRSCSFIFQMLLRSHAAPALFRTWPYFKYLFKRRVGIRKVNGGESRGAHLVGGTSSMGSSLGIRIKPPISETKTRPSAYERGKRVERYFFIGWIAR